MRTGQRRLRKAGPRRGALVQVPLCELLHGLHALPERVSRGALHAPLQAARKRLQEGPGKAR